MIRALVAVAATLCALHAGIGHTAPFKDCRMYFAKQLPHRSGRVNAVIDAAAVELASRNYDGARKLLQDQVEQESDNARFWLYDAIGTSYGLEKRPADAAEAFARSAALDLNVRGKYEARRKLAFAQASAGQHPAAIATLEQMQREVCTPLAGTLAYQLAASYLHEGKVAEADQALAPLRLDPGEPGTARYLGLELRIQCANLRARACVERFLGVQARHELDEVDAAWFSRLIPAIAKSGMANDLLAQAREKGWIDAAGQAVVTASGDGARGSALVPVKRVSPQYPPQAVRQRISGWAELAVTVTPEGNVREVSVIESRPPGVFEQAAIDAVRRWKFQAKVVDGLPVEATGRQRVDFLIEQD